MLFESKPDIKDLNDFFKDIHRYGAANISVTESVPIFRDSVDKPILKKIMENLTRDLENGVAFPTALSKHPSFFPSFVVEMLKMGLSTGQTTALLNEIVVDLEQKIDIKREINPTLWTTKIFILLLLGLLAIAIFFVIPMLGDLLADTHAEMPLITKMVVGFCGIMQSFWWLFSLIGVAGFFVYRYLCREKPEQIDLLKLKIPFFKVITYNQLQYNFAKIFGLCIKAGISTTMALNYAAMSSENVAFKNTLKTACNDMERTGISLVEALQKADKYKLINPPFYRMFRVGLSTSNLGNIMLGEAEIYRKEILLSTKLVGNKVGVACTIPGYILLIVLFASVQYPLISIMQNASMSGGM